MHRRRSRTGKGDDLSRGLKNDLASVLLLLTFNYYSHSSRRKVFC